MATYVNDLRLKEIATGDESGTWGTSTNTNLELIGEALGYATQQVFSSDADATTTVADGASDPARAMYFKITSAGNLTATRTCTIAPNTVSRVMFIENATSGSQSIAISQGSGANVTIATGKTAVVYLDGAGSGAAVVDAMAGVDPGVTDTLAEVLTAGNTTTTDQKIQFRDSAIYINSSADGQLDLVADTEIQIAATTVDLNGNLDISGTATGASSFATAAGGTFTTAAGNDLNIVYPAGRSLFIKEGSETHVTVDNVGSVGIGTSSPAGLLNLHSASGDSNLFITTGNTAAATNIFFGDTDNSSVGRIVYDHGSNYMNFRTNGSDAARITSTGKVGIGNSAPLGKLTISNAAGTNAPTTVTAANTYLQLGSDDYGPSNNGKFMIGFGFTDATNTNSPAYIGYEEASTSGDTYGDLTFYTRSVTTDTAPTERMRIDSAGNVGIGVVPSAAYKLQVNVATNTVSTGSPAASSLVNISGGTTTVGDGVSLNLSNISGAKETVWRISAVTASGNNGDLVFNGYAGGADYPERMRITSTGNVEIKSGGELVTYRADNTRTGKVYTDNNAMTLIASNDPIKYWANATSYHAFGFGTDTSTNEKVRITSAGNVGIGTNSPNSYSGQTTLTINSTGVARLDLDINDAYQGYLLAEAGYIGLYAQSGNYISMGVGGVGEVVRIDASGNLLVGTTTSRGRITATAADGVAAIGTTVATAINYTAASFTNSAGTQVGRIIANNAGTTQYVTSSDQRLKENIADADDAGSKIDAIQVRKFDWKADGSHQKYGMVAQELLEVAPEAVSQGDTEEDMMGVDYSKLVPMMLKEIQSLRARINALEAE